ncbi:MAG TPA: HD-GYP domain-containing protein [Dehalococcoidia bacterium]|nr:HD-GYP domain-containing protein [Dehalococcoidia bacterium]
MHLTWRFWTFWGALLASPVAAFLLLLARPQWDSRFMDTTFHFWVVSGTAVAATVACALFLARARSLRETRTLFLGLAFMSIAGIFAVHGLTTPGHIHHALHAELRVSAWLSVLAGASFVACSAVTLPPHADDWLRRNGSYVFAIVALALAGYIIMAFVSPDWLAFVPADDRRLQLAFTAVSMTLLAFSAYRYFQSFLFARLPSQWAMVVALVLLIEVQMSLTWGRLWYLSWWEYHVLYGLAFVVLFAGWAIEAWRAGSLSVFADGLTMRDALGQLNRGYSQPLADLVDAIELKDLYTLGHVRRVAAYALLTGQELKLSPLEQRKLALAAQMHDVGKIGTPDRILMKPGKLTPEEFEVIKEHVQRGYEIALKVKALRPVAAAIRYHHEKFDGSGYPDGLSGEAIPLLSRIVSVVDAYDAMTSGRVYQPAVDHEAAVAELRRCSGTHFDPGCVQAFLTAMSRRAAGEEPGVPPRPRLSLDASAA